MALSSIINIDIRPWGSTCTVIVNKFWEAGLEVPVEVAGPLYTGIVSDTLNLASPTTTEYDAIALDELEKVLGMRMSRYDFAFSLFQAKSNFTGIPISEIILLDHKTYEMNNTIVAVGTQETVEPEFVLDNLDEYIEELLAYQAAEGFAEQFYTVVSILEQTAFLVITGPRELAIAQEVFGGELSFDDRIMDLGGRTSRKLTIVPPLQEYYGTGNDDGIGLEEEL